jgi:hypothetical protein
MRKATKYFRSSAAPAIAAALALSPTHALAQEAPAQPVTAEPTPVAADPVPAETSPPATSDTTAATPEAPAPARTATKTRHTATKASAPAATRTVTQKVRSRTTHAVTPAAAAPAQPAAAPSANASAVKPVVDTTPRPAPAQTAAKPVSDGSNETAMEIGGGALALIALGAGAFALSRRRRDEDEVVYDETYEPETMETAEPMPRHDPMFEEQPPIVAPEVSAFAWGNPQPATQAADDDGSDRRPGETWVERAYRGPSPANPSVSLKNRLRRAAFFDKREREVEAGKAEPVDTDAGLPDAMIEEQERELA